VPLIILRANVCGETAISSRLGTADATGVSPRITGDNGYRFLVREVEASDRLKAELRTKLEIGVARVKGFPKYMTELGMDESTEAIFGGS
jgi:hypothetical protein